MTEAEGMHVAELEIQFAEMDGSSAESRRSEERRVGKSVDLGGSRIIKKKN